MPSFQTNLCPFFWGCLYATVLEEEFNSIFRGQCLGLVLEGLAITERPCDVFIIKKGPKIKFCPLFRECNVKTKRAMTNPDLYKKQCLGLREKQEGIVITGLIISKEEACENCNIFTSHKRKSLEKIAEDVPELWE